MDAFANFALFYCIWMPVGHALSADALARSAHAFDPEAGGHEEEWSALPLPLPVDVGPGRLVFQGQNHYLPATSFTTEALWYELGDEVLRDLPPEALLGALHAAEHTQIAVLPLLAMCDRWDIGGLSTNMHPQTGRPTVFIYDGHPGGVGITRRGFHEFDVLTGDAHRLIAECPCKAGCPSCVQSPKCGNLNEPLHKRGALEVLGRMLDRA